MTESEQELNRCIEHEALKPTHGYGRRSHLLSLLVPLAVVLVMWPKVDQLVLVGWAVLMAAGIVLRHRLARVYMSQKVSSENDEKWVRSLSVLILYFALLWASAIFLFFVDDSIEYQVFLICITLMLAAGAINAAQYRFCFYYLYSPVIAAALAIRLMMEGTFAYIALSILMLWAGFGMILFAQKLHHTVRSEMRLRHESVLLNKALEVKAREAQDAAVAKSRFLAAASHDLRQPLHSLSLFIDVLKDTKANPEQAAIFPRVDASLNALRKLFDALLDISRLDAETVSPTISHFDLNGLMASLAEEFRPEATQKGLKLKLFSKSTTVVSDRLLLERVLRNLISNAIRYTDRGGVLVSSRQYDGSVLLQVWDSGIGIPDESRDEIFVEFQQLHNAHRDRSEGLGLGLALVKRMCQLLNHPLELRSRLGSGSVFSIRIPLGNASLVDERRSNERTHSWTLDGRRILVIDDEKEILSAMDALLSRWGCQVHVAESLDDAITQLTQHDVLPDLILSDLRLRDDATGIEAIDGLRQHLGVDVPGLLITGDTAPERIRLTKQSHYEVLQKPVRPAHLRSVIHQLLKPAS